MKLKLLVAAVAIALSSHAVATPLTGTSGSGAPVIGGSTAIVDFESQSNATFSSFTSNGVTFSGVGGSLRTDNSYAGQYNGRGTRYLDNNGGATPTIRFDFLSPVSAFAFNWGASDVAWTLRAFSAGGTLLESFVTPITMGSNAGDYIGLADAGIAFATLTSSDSRSSDWVFVDNFILRAGTVDTAAVPEPATYALLGLGLLGLTVAGRRRRAPAVA